PSSRTRRSSETDLIWNASAPDSLVRPFSGVGDRCTNHENWVNTCFHSVIGITSRRGKRPTSGTFTITAGRIFRISAPTAGLNSTLPDLAPHGFTHSWRVRPSPRQLVRGCAGTAPRLAGPDWPKSADAPSRGDASTRAHL